MDEFQQRVTERLDRIERRQTILLLLVCIGVIWLTGLTLGSDIHIATLDREQIPQQEWPFIYYVTCENVPIEHRAELIAAMKFAICSTTRAVVIENQLPQQVSPTLWRIDLRNLGWEQAYPDLTRKYPYSVAPGNLTLLVRADWLVQISLDMTKDKDVYFSLLYGKDAPQNAAQFKALLEVTGTKYEHGFIEGNSGVSVQGTRLITTTPTAGRFDFWQTFDSRVIAGDSDPLEKLDRTQKFDAQELIGALPKTVASTGALGCLEVYALSNAAGAIQTEAPIDIVLDHTNVRGPAIRNPLSCICCHRGGLQPLKANALRELIASGAEVYAGYKDKIEVERFHLASLDGLIDRQNADVAVITKAVNGLTPAANAAALTAVIRAYDAPLDLAAVARELRARPEDVKLALGYAGNVPARLAGLAHGGELTREMFELYYFQLRTYLEAWRAK